jgi:4'-phosphopantetheinyl transferase
MRSPADRTAQPRYLAVGMADVPDHDDWLATPEAERLQSFAYTKRREEARLGRWTAKQALAHALGRDRDPATLRELVIRNAADGAPEAFLGTTRVPLHISMTDRADWAACTVAPTAPVGRSDIGCDLEVVEPRSPQFVADWFTPAEQELVAGGAERDLLANLIWSAKESALKVLRTGLRRDTRSVEVLLTDERVHGWRRLHVTTTEGDIFPGWWRRFGSFVLTYAAARDTPPPASFIEPSPLDAAEPAHTWMASPLRVATVSPTVSDTLQV